MELRTQSDPWGRCGARTRCVALRAPRANRGEAKVVQHAAEKLLSRPHYFTQVQQLTDQGPQLILGCYFPIRRPLDQHVAKSLQLGYGNGDDHSHGMDIPPEHAQHSIPRRYFVRRQPSGIPWGSFPEKREIVRRQRRRRASTMPTIGPPPHFQQNSVICIISHEKKQSRLPPPCPPGTLHADGKGGGRSIALGGLTATCCVAVFPCSITTAYDVWR